MRLFVNRKEVPVLELSNQSYSNGAKETMAICGALYERIELCERLQDSERKAKDSLYLINKNGEITPIAQEDD